MSIYENTEFLREMASARRPKRARKSGTERPGPDAAAKFYYMHLSREQQTEFIRLYNEKVMKVDYPGRFYVPPFFMSFKP